MHAVSPHVAVSIFIMNSSGAVLLQLRDDKAPVCPDVWGTVGGEVEPGETPDEAAARELAEETGLTDVPLTPLWVVELPADSGSGTTVRHVYGATADLVDDDITVGEGADIRFVPPDQALDLPMTPATRVVLTQYLDAGWAAAERRSASVANPAAGIRSGTGMLRDYEAWHHGYDDPDSGLSWRLRTVQREISDALDERPGPVRVVSVCAGDGRDLIGVLAARDDAARVRVTLLEVNPALTDRARTAAAAAGLQLDLRQVDAGRSDAYFGAVPADVVLFVGVFGNISTADLRRTIAAAPQLCAPGARLLWSRGRDIDAAGDRSGEIRAAFVQAGFGELRLHTYDAPDGGRPSLGVVRYDGHPHALVRDEHWFTFLR
jgi:8-oxo-dGTP pyrophosphatase MutT (NUDIX family)